MGFEPSVNAQPMRPAGVIGCILVANLLYLYGNIIAENVACTIKEAPPERRPSEKHMRAGMFFSNFGNVALMDIPISIIEFAKIELADPFTDACLCALLGLYRHR